MEPLVYVRLETLGSRLEELDTRAINEHLLGGLLERLAGLGAAGASGGYDMARGAHQHLGAQVVAATRPVAPSEPTGGRLEVAEDLASQRLAAERCKEAMERFLCRLVYPSCHFRRADVSALVRPPCREDCLLLRDVWCPNLNWPQFAAALREATNATLKSAINALDLAAEGAIPIEAAADELEAAATAAALATSGRPDPSGRHRQQLAAGASRGAAQGYNLTASSLHFYWPHERSIESCELLPPLRPLLEAKIGPVRDGQENGLAGRGRRRAIWRRAAAAAARWPICSDAQLTRAGPGPGPARLATSAHCLSSPDGADYVGQRNKTQAGLACQRWDEQRPHSHPR